MISFSKEDDEKKRPTMKRCNKLGHSPPPLIISPLFGISIIASAMVFAFIAGGYARRLLLSDTDKGLMYPDIALDISSYSSPIQDTSHQPTCKAHSFINSSTNYPLWCDSEECLQESGDLHHLLVDIENVDGIVLDSENKLKDSILQIFNQDNTELITTNCQRSMSSEGLLCYGLTSTTRVTFSTWPSKGAVAVDLFTSSLHTVVESIPVFERMFKTPTNQSPTAEPDHRLNIIKWTYKNRVRDESVLSRLAGGKRTALLNWMDSQDNAIRINRVTRSQQLGEVAFHEALVHPVMFLQEDHDPQRVAIVGGVLGGSLREVLKHNTVEEVVLVGVDEKFVEMAREHLPEWSDCSNLMGSTPSCFDDPRVEFVFEDAASWFTSNFLDESDDSDDEDLFNVIIVDILYPTSTLDYLLDDEDLLTSLYNSLEDSGVISVPTGRVEKLTDRSSSPKQSLYQLFLDEVDDVGFESVLVFSEAHSYSHPQSFLAILKDFKLQANWFINEAEANLLALEKGVKTKNSTPFRYFDGATMMSYKYPSRIDEDIYCGQIPIPDECTGHGFDPDRENYPSHFFVVKHSNVSGNAGRGVYAKEHVPAGSYVALDECVNGMYVPPWTAEIMDELHLEGLPYWNTFRIGYVEGYGWSDYVHGEESFGVDPGLFTFVNHGCNGTNNIGVSLNVTEENAEFGIVPSPLASFESDLAVYSPYELRHFPMWECGDTSVTIKDIEAGGEVLENYMDFYGEDSWDDALADLKQWCSGEGVGPVTEYEADNPN